MPVWPGQSLRQKRGQGLHLGAPGARRRGNEIEAAKGHAPIGKQGFHLAFPQQIEGYELWSHRTGRYEIVYESTVFGKTLH
jgi:hypothetical protein